MLTSLAMFAMLAACSENNLQLMTKPGHEGEPGEDTGLLPDPEEERCDVEDIWEIPTSHATDILFSLDSSCSMTEDIWELYLNFDAFVNELTSFSDNWQMMVVNADDGCNHSGVLRPSTPNFADTFKDALFAWNWDNEFTEALLTVNAAAIDKTDSGECNGGFLRENAMLHIIDITDEPEQSVDISGKTWDQLVDSIVAKKGSLVLTTISAIAGDVPDGCDGASAGTGYAEAVDATGGVFLSICQNWATTSNLGMLAAASVNQDTFALSEIPVESTLTVRHNGTVTSAWVYDANLNAVVIIGPAPGANDRVRITYKTVCG